MSWDDLFHWSLVNAAALSNVDAGPVCMCQILNLASVRSVTGRKVPTRGFIRLSLQGGCSDQKHSSDIHILLTQKCTSLGNENFLIGRDEMIKRPFQCILADSSCILPTRWALFVCLCHPRIQFITFQPAKAEVCCVFPLKRGWVGGVYLRRELKHTFAPKKALECTFCHQRNHFSLHFCITESTQAFTLSP